jgi:hypothetical protein
VEVAALDPEELSDRAIRILGLESVGVDLFGSESLATSLRRAASFLSPAPKRAIVRSVLEVLEGLPGFSDETEGLLETLLDALIGCGDLLQLQSDDPDFVGQRIVLGPPAFVRRDSGAVLLVGVRPDGATLVPTELSARIEYDGHTRIVRPSDDIDELLELSGLVQLDTEQWLSKPRASSSLELLEEYQKRLNIASASGQIERARILDPSRPVRYYAGRWRNSNSKDTGGFVARRPQIYGADLWCFAELKNGEFVRLIDLPINDPVKPAHDEGWRLQAAIDAEAGNHQLIEYKTGLTSTRLNFFSPVPSWAQRRLDIIGTPLLRDQGALFSYSLPNDEVVEELEFLRKMMWTTASEQQKGNQA